MSGTSSPLPDRPESPGSVRTAPVSEPAWLKRASAALVDDLPVEIQEVQLTETITEESTTGADNNSSTDPTLDDDTAATPPPAPYSIADLNNKFHEILARVEKLETTGTEPAPVDVPKDNDEIVAPMVSPVIVTTEKSNLDTRMILSSKTGRSYLPVSRGMFASIYGRRRNN
tara:strand:- start:8361 stop:8876 length:516 start_codon:yes stop_codon:yes gene_type:complete